jgi:hypothetical protein
VIGLRKPPTKSLTSICLRNTMFGVCR